MYLVPYFTGYLAHMSEVKEQVATLGAGCYWCVEAVLQQVPGVLGLRSGFMGGDVEDPSYEAVCMGVTGHAEVVEVSFDANIIDYRELLGWFWRLHDPTTLNRQGADEGTQYRSAIFTHSAEQLASAKESMRLADQSGVFPAPIVTQIAEADTFFAASETHQDYYRRNSNQGYCHMVIRPKLEKLGLEY
jgi:peptide-methionine (S)-S-oxide reductase